LERSVLNTKAIHEVVETNRVVALVADWSDNEDTASVDEINRTFEALGGKQLPLLAIFPADDPYRPIVLKGVYTRQQLARELNRAGPSNDRRLARAAEKQTAGQR
jgi:hypothetical protein